MDLMRYRECIATIEFGDSLGLLYGTVLGTRDVIDFYGSTPLELREEFKNSVDEYLAWCGKEGTKPEKSLQVN